MAVIKAPAKSGLKIKPIQTMPNDTKLHAMHLKSALLLDSKFGDEVIMPSYTFVSTANAFALRGAQIKFIDIRQII